jgi:putative aldouronate transport system permease protein
MGMAVTQTKIGKRKLRWALYLMLVPGIIVTLIYAYGPLMGLVIAFQDFEPAKGLFGSDWVGFDNFRYIFGLRDFRRALQNTLFIASVKIVLNMILPIAVAILLNEVRHTAYKRTVQTLVYLPFFISWVIVAGLFLDILSPSTGIVNYILKSFGIEPIYFMGNADVFPWVLIFTDTWKEFGMGTVLYMAALTGIDPNLYEAASIDGANRFRRMLHITLPGLTAIIVLTGTLKLGSVLNAGFDQIVNMYNPTVYRTGDILDTLVYRVGIQPAGQSTLPRYEIATAIGMFKSVVSSSLIAITYYLAYKIADYRIF